MIPRWLARVVAWWRRRRGPRPPAALARAVAECSYRCLECQSPVVKLHYAPALGWVPTVRHWQVGGEWCPALSGGLVAELESYDLLDALATALAPVGHYGEPVWHARELVAA